MSQLFFLGQQICRLLISANQAYKTDEREKRKKVIGFNIFEAKKCSANTFNLRKDKRTCKSMFRFYIDHR